MTTDPAGGVPVTTMLGAIDRRQPARPIHWPSLTAEEARQEWDALRTWFEALRARFPNIVRLPDCWWRHNDLVEALAALRDGERAAFATNAPASAPVDWLRALREIDSVLETWIKRSACSVPGRGHAEPTRLLRQPEGWGDFVKADVRLRTGDGADRNGRSHHRQQDDSE